MSSSNAAAFLEVKPLVLMNLAAPPLPSVISEENTEQLELSPNPYPKPRVILERGGESEYLRMSPDPKSGGHH